jgi:hypothetical protein
MSSRRTVAAAAAFAALASCVALPAANAAPNPGDPCSTPAPRTSVDDGSLWCDMQAGVWLSNGPSVTVGQPCSRPGDVRLARGGSGEDIAHCAGGVWVLGLR